MNLPNKLTVGRFFLTMIFLAFASVPDTVSSHLIFWRVGFIIGIIGGWTDFFDGYIARKYNLVTDFGKLMDPLTDKIFTVTAFVVMTENEVVPGWITVLILTREFAVTGLRTMAANKGVVLAASQLGKIKTVVQMVSLILGGAIWVKWTPGLKETPWLANTWYVILGGIVIVTFWSGIEYFVKGRSLYLDKMS